MTGGAHTTRHEILDYVTYGEQRDAIRTSAIAAKEQRRVLALNLRRLLESKVDVERELKQSSPRA